MFSKTERNIRARHHRNIAENSNSPMPETDSNDPLLSEPENRQFQKESSEHVSGKYDLAGINKMAGEEQERTDHVEEHKDFQAESGNYVQEKYGRGNKMSREKRYEVALALSDYDPAKVEGFDEFKPRGYRYDPNKSYNEVIRLRNATGAKDITEKNLISAYNGYYFDLNTNAGRIMYSQMMKAKGAPYEPPADLLIQQMVEKKGEERAIKDAEQGLTRSLKIMLALKKKIDSSSTPAEEKKELTAKHDKVEDATLEVIKVILEDKKKKEKENGNNNGKSKVQEANALAVGEVLAWLGTALIATLAVTFAFLLSKAIYNMYRTWEETDTEDVDVEDVDITDALPENVTLPKDKDRPDKNPNNKPKPDPLVPVPGPGDRKKKDDECEPIDIPHKGGSTYHDDIADRVPPNLKPGKDWLLKGKAFDSWTGHPKDELWEVKTSDYSNDKKYNKFTRQWELEKIISDAETEAVIAHSCGYHSVLGVTDRMLFQILLSDLTLSQTGVEIRLVK
jgi:hypothetical protein